MAAWSQGLRTTTVFPRSLTKVWSRSKTCLGEQHRNIYIRFGERALHSSLTIRWIPSGRLTYKWNIPMFNRKYIFKGSFSIVMLVFRSVWTGSFGCSLFPGTSQIHAAKNDKQKYIILLRVRGTDRAVFLASAKPSYFLTSRVSFLATTNTSGRLRGFLARRHRSHLLVGWYVERSGSKFGMNIEKIEKIIFWESKT